MNGTQSQFVELCVNAPAPSDPRMRSIIADAVKSRGLSSRDAERRGARRADDGDPRAHGA